MTPLRNLMARVITNQSCGKKDVIMMFFLILGILSVLFIVVSIIAQKEAKKCRIIMAANDFTVRKSTRNLSLCMVVTIICLVFTLILLTNNNVQIVTFNIVQILICILLFIPCFLIGFLPIVLWLRWKITVKDDQITYTPYFGSKKIFTFDYITIVKYGNKMDYTKAFGYVKRDYIKAYHERGKLFYLLDNSDGFQALVSYLKDKSVPFKW